MVRRRFGVNLHRVMDWVWLEGRNLTAWLPQNCTREKGYIIAAHACMDSWYAPDEKGHYAWCVCVCVCAPALATDSVRNHACTFCNSLFRRMFPGFSVAISSLKPKVKYSMTYWKLFLPITIGIRWLAVGIMLSHSHWLYHMYILTHQILELFGWDMVCLLGNWRLPVTRRNQERMEVTQSNSELF